MADTVRVQVCHARPDSVFLEDLVMSAGASLRQALFASSLQKAFPELDLSTAKIGVHGKLRALDDLLREGDRIEVYRPLLADPKDARRRRVVRERKLQGK